MPIVEAWPEDTKDKKYLCIPGGIEVVALEEFIQTYWPDVHKSEFIISTEYIHINHLGYDLHDEIDWANFLVIERKSEEI